MESGPRPRKEQDLGLNQISCPYFVSSTPNGSMGSPRMCQRNDEYRQVSSGLKYIRGMFTLSIGFFGYS
ncbi:Glycoprotein G [Gossypium arboreum]|uniref:Glycoprotein G n=1 Tax=Gossypium arboreum TaxID=29729 RepID=A0A0B0NZ42_GOSAR|nr:Glycoprotein G [Gossypium arboreum]